MTARSPSEETPDRDATASPAPGPPPAPAAPPGSPDAVAEGCCCSVLANAGYRTGADAAPLVDPACPLDHR